MSGAQDLPSSLFLREMEWQFRMSWALLRDVHLSHLTDEVCAWLPHPAASTVRVDDRGIWHGDWDEPAEGEPWAVSVGWLTWHLQLWLTQAVAEFGARTVPPRDAVFWPGGAAATIEVLGALADEWAALLHGAHHVDLDRPTRFPWPDPRPLHRLVSWANMEMMKNAAEIGIVMNAARFALRP